MDSHEHIDGIAFALLDEVHRASGRLFRRDCIQALALGALLAAAPEERIALLEKGSAFLDEVKEFESFARRVNEIRKVSTLLEAAKAVGVLDPEYRVGAIPSTDAIIAAELRDRGWSPYFESRKKKGGGWVEELAPAPEKIAAMRAALASLDA